MGCGASAPVQTIADAPVTEQERGVTRTEAAKDSLDIAEAEAVKTKAGTETFIASCLKARAECADDGDVLLDVCTRLQAHNRRLKEYVAIYDCQTVNEAMNGGFLGLGCNDHKLIVTLCTRTKSLMQRTRKQYRKMYDKDLRAEVKGETGSGSYGRMCFFGMAAKDEYVADIIDLACDASILTSLGCDETCLIEVFVTHTQAELQAGKRVWEGRRDKSLIDYITKELSWPSGTYTLLKRLLFLLYTGDRDEAADAADEAKAARQAEAVHAECAKGWFEAFESSVVIETIGANSTAQNGALALVYEKAYEESLGKALKAKCGDRLHYALTALLLTKADFLAMRLHDAMKGWLVNKDILSRLLGGLDGEKMVGVVEAYERKYSQPLWSALAENVSSSSLFYSAAHTWVRSWSDPSRVMAERFTEADVSSLSGDAKGLANMLDYLFLEHESLLVCVAQLDVETIREAVKGWGADDTALIRAFATRNKRALARVNLGYRDSYQTTLQELIEAEISGRWYSYLAKFLVVQAEQADLMILDLAMDDTKVDHQALVEFLCARHPKRVRAAKEKWEGFHDDSLVDKLSDELGERGDMARLALLMLKGKRDTDDDDKVDDGLARKQAHRLHDGGADYIEVLGGNSAGQNALCAKHYEEAYDTSLRRAISQEYSGPVKNALLALLQGPAEWYAAQLKAALTGHEVNDKSICRILGAHDKDEVKAIAAAYEKKYNEPLKRAVTERCSGNYKRLAVAWIDLPDQLAQPDKTIAIPTKEDVPEGAHAPTMAHGATLLDNEISEDDDDFADDILHTSPLYAAKSELWTRKYEKYNGMGKAHKAEHYQRLLLSQPPTAKGHRLLGGFFEALTEEYKASGRAADDWTSVWFGTLADDRFEAAGTTRDVFKRWLDVTESMVAEKKVSLNELKSAWGLRPKPALAKQKSYIQPVALTPYQPPPVAQAMLPVAHAIHVPPQPPVYPSPSVPIYGQPQPPIYGQPQQPMGWGQPPVVYPTAAPTTTTTTTTTYMATSMYSPMPIVQQPMFYGAPQPQQVVYYQ